MIRCYVCRHPVAPITRQGRKVCRGCQKALPRVLELESTESFLVSLLMDVQRTTKEPTTARRVESALERLGSAFLVDFESVRRIMERIVEVLDPRAGKGHALELIREDHQHTIGGQRQPVYSCVMPRCEVCAVVGVANSVLQQLQETPPP